MIILFIRYKLQIVCLSESGDVKLEVSSSTEQIQMQLFTDKNVKLFNAVFNVFKCPMAGLQLYTIWQSRSIYKGREMMKQKDVI